MNELIPEILRVLATVAILTFLWSKGKNPAIRGQRGWRWIIAGFALLLFGEVLDMTDNYESLNRFVVIGDTPTESILEKVVGFLGGMTLIFIGFVLWMPLVDRLRAAEAKVRAHSESLQEAVDQKTAQLQASILELESAERDRRLLTEKVLSASEEERSRLAADLHDGPVQALTVLSMNLDLVLLECGQEHGALREDLDGLQEQLGASIDSVRKMMANLRPPALDSRGLAAATTDFLDRLDHSDPLDISTTLELTERPSEDVETVIYRVMQEAVTNVVRHAHASRLDVALRTTPTHVELVVEDDGRGFDPGTRHDAEHHFGLLAMNERVSGLGGDFEVISVAGKGTQVRARVACRNSAGVDRNRIVGAAL